jgi:hypothetical protein
MEFKLENGFRAVSLRDRPVLQHHLAHPAAKVAHYCFSVPIADGRTKPVRAISPQILHGRALAGVAAVIPAVAPFTRRHLCTTALPTCTPTSLSHRVPSCAAVVPTMPVPTPGDKVLHSIAASFSPAGTACGVHLGLQLPSLAPCRHYACRVATYPAPPCLAQHPTSTYGQIFPSHALHTVHRSAAPR